MPSHTPDRPQTDSGQALDGCRVGRVDDSTCKPQPAQAAADRTTGQIATTSRKRASPTIVIIVVSGTRPYMEKPLTKP